MKNELISLIKETKILNELQREQYLNSVDTFSDEQVLNLSNFFKEAEIYVAEAEKKEKEKLSLIYKKYLTIIQDGAQKIKKEIFRMSERNSQNKDEEEEKFLLTSLDSL